MKLAERLHLAKVHAAAHLRAVAGMNDWKPDAEDDVVIAQVQALLVIAECQVERLERAAANEQTIADLKQQLVTFLASRGADNVIRAGHLDTTILSACERRDAHWIEALTTVLTIEAEARVKEWITTHHPLSKAADIGGRRETNAGGLCAAHTVEWLRSFCTPR